MLVGNKLRPGFVGVVQITSIEVKPTEYGKCAFTELTVIETNMPEQHWRGAPVVWVQGLKNEEIAKSAFKEFLLALGVPEAEMESTINAAIESPQSNVLTNRRVHVQTHETQTKNGPFVLHNWFPYTPPSGDPHANLIPAAEAGACGEHLKPEHVAYLEQRAVPLAVATAAGLVSVNAARAAQLLQLLPEQVPSGGLAMPYPHLEPKFWRVRMDGAEGGAKFMAPPGRGAPIYDAVAATGSQVPGPLVVPEGPIKALALVANGFRGVGLGGAETGLTKEHELDPSWEPIEFPPEGVILLPDADIITNYGVMRGTARLACALSKAHPELAIKFARLSGPGKRGPDDYLAEHGEEALRKILESATSARPSDIAGNLAELDKDERSRRIAQLLEDKFFLVSVIVWGDAEYFLARDSFRKGGATKPFDRAIKTTTDALRKANRHDASGPDTGPYRVKDGRFYFVKKVTTSAGEVEIPEQLTNFTASITCEKKLDDGVIVQTILTIRVTRDTGDNLGEQDVPAAEFGGGRAWLVDKFTSDAVVLGTPGAMAHARAAIQLFSPEKERISAYNHIGFREIDGKLMYLHAGGAVGGEGVTVLVDESLQRFRLPDTCEDLRGAVLMSLRLLDVAAERISGPLFCATYLAPLCHWISVGFAPWVWGQTGTFKTSVIAACQAHYGNFDKDHLPGSWLSTPASLEYLLSRAKDALTIIDDFVPKSAHELDETRRKGSQVIRSIGNNAARGRMRQDLTARPDRPPRGLAAVTGEDVLSGESASARTFAIRFERKLVDKDVLTALQKNAKRLPTAMRGYIEYLITQDAWLRANAQNRITELRASFSADGLHARQPEAAATLMFAAEVFAGFGLSSGVYDHTSSQAFLERIKRALVEASAEHSAGAEERKPVTRFLNTLASLIAQAKVKIEDDAQAKPLPMFGDTFIGCRDGDRLRLLPEPTFRAVTSAMRDAGDPFPVSNETLWAEFQTLGFLAEHDPGRTTKKLVCGGVRTRVLVLWAKHVEGEPEGEPQPDQPGAPAPPAQGPDRPAAPRTNSPSGAHLTPGDASASGEDAPTAPRLESTFTCRDGSPVADHDHSLEERLPVSLPGDSGAIGASAEKFNGHGHLERPGTDVSAGPERGAAGRESSPEFVLVTDATQLPAVAEAVAAASSVALDTETTGLDPLKDRVRIVQLALPDGTIYVIDTWATGGLGPAAEVLCRVPWLGHNLAFDVGFMRQLGVAPTRVVDTMLLAQVLDCGLHLGTKGYFTLPALLKRHLGIEMTKDEQKSDWSGTLRPEQLVYAARDVQHLHELVEVLAHEAATRGLAATASLECQVLPAIVDLRLAGVCFDRGRWAALTEQRRGEAAEARAFVERELGITNANSAVKQLLPALQKRLGAGVTGTSAEVLAPYADDPVVTALEKFRVAAAFVKNHGEPILAAMSEYSDGRARADWIQIAAPTGRMACRNPPLLNLPKSPEVRSCVIAPPGCVLVVADYSQIELRVAAQYLGVTRLRNVYGTAGGDVHRMMAALIAGVRETEVADEQRHGAKPVNFGFLFGMGPPSFINKAREYDVEFALEEARKFQATYRRAYPEIERWQRQIRSTMPIEMRTIGGRARAFPDRRNGYTDRLNMPIQGTAADGFKLAIAILHPRLAALGARIVLAVHDELVVEAPEDRAEEVRACVEAGMIEGMARHVTSVPIEIEASIVRNWAEKK